MSCCCSCDSFADFSSNFCSTCAYYDSSLNQESEKIMSEDKKEEKIQLKLVIQADATMQALSNLGEALDSSIDHVNGYTRQLRPAHRRPRPILSLLTPDNQEIAGVEDIRLDFSTPMRPVVKLSLSQVKLDIQVDPEFFAIPEKDSDPEDYLGSVMAGTGMTNVNYAYPLPTPKMKSAAKGTRLAMGQTLPPQAVPSSAPTPDFIQLEKILNEELISGKLAESDIKELFDAIINSERDIPVAVKQEAYAVLDKVLNIKQFDPCV